MMHIKPQIQENQTLNRQKVNKQKQTNPRYIILKHYNTKDKGTILKEVGGGGITYRKVNLRTTTDLS